MATVYSAYEAKAKLAEILRRVRSGARVTITYRGEAVAEIRPLKRKPQSLAARLDALIEDGRVVPARGPGSLRALARRRGSLRRFLEERE